MQLAWCCWQDDADSGYQSGNSTMTGARQVSTQDVSARCQLIYRVDCYNVNCRHTGLTMTVVSQVNPQNIQRLAYQSP